MTLAAWLHQIDPYAIQLWEGGPVRWYGLSYLLGFAIAYALVRRVLRVGRSTVAVAQAGDLIVTLAIGIVVGGRVGYVLFYKPQLLWTVFDHVPWWGLLAINDGGMASHGGMIGGLIAALMFARRHQVDALHTFDLFAFGAPLGLFFGRIANFVNGELIGRPAPDGLPWAVKFPRQMYEWPAEKVRRAMMEWNELPGHLPITNARQFVPDAIARIQAGDAQMIQIIEPMLVARHPSQLYAAAMEGLIVFAVLLFIWRRPRMPGVVAGWFGISYAVMRIIDEWWRRPDPHLRDDEFAATREMLGWGITRGQWLSVLLLLVGAALVFVALRRDVSPMGAWRRGPWTGDTSSNAPAETDQSRR